MESIHVMCGSRKYGEGGVNLPNFPVGGGGGGCHHREIFPEGCRDA